MRLLAALALAVMSMTPAQAEDSPQTASTMPPVTGSATSKAMNPDLAVDGLFALSQFNKDTPLVFDGGHDPHQTGFNLQQLEMTFGANVDPYLRSDANIVLTQEGVEIEEAYATTLSLPLDLQLKAGKFLTAFGRLNPTHPHTWDFADRPLVEGRFFSGDGLRGIGAQLSWLTPLPWFSEVLVSAQNSNDETAVSFNAGGTQRALNELNFLLRWSNFFSLTDTLSLNLGASYLVGPNGEGTHTKIVGADLFFKFREESSLSFITLQAEALDRLYDTSRNDWGWYAQLDFRLPEGWERWHLGARLDWVSPKNGVPVITSAGPKDASGNATDLDVAQRWRVSPVITFYPSEFSKLRLQYDYDKPADYDSAQQVVTLELEFLMGAHGAHKF